LAHIGHAQETPSWNLHGLKISDGCSVPKAGIKLNEIITGKGSYVAEYKLSIPDHNKPAAQGILDRYKADLVAVEKKGVNPI